MRIETKTRWIWLALLAAGLARPAAAEQAAPASASAAPPVSTPTPAPSSTPVAAPVSTPAPAPASTPTPAPTAAPAEDRYRVAVLDLPAPRERAHVASLVAAAVREAAAADERLDVVPETLVDQARVNLGRPRRAGAVGRG